MGLLGAPVLAQELPSIRVDVRLVNLPFSVRDGQGRLVRDLTKDDIEVLEDGVPQRVTHFSAGGASALTLGLVADVSGSQEDFLKAHRRDLRDFLKNVAQARDRAFLVCFANQLRMVAPLTGQMEEITDRLEAYQKGKGRGDYERVGPAEQRDLGSAVYDGVYYSVKEMARGGDEGRRALILFSDGEDNSSAHHMMETIEAAQQEGVQVFCVRYTELKKGRWTARNKYGRGVMERLAKETGGLDLDATEAEDLRPQFRAIADILRASYDLGYTSSNGERDGTFRKVVVRAKGREGLVFRHKTGYFARGE